MSSAAQYDTREPLRQRLYVVSSSPAAGMETHAEILSGPTFGLTPLESTEQSDGLLLVDDIPVRSICECHMLPFVGVAHVGYLPGELILGPSKVARVVDFFGHRPQTQDRMTKQVAEYLQEQLSPRGIGVVVDAQHSCTTMCDTQTVGARSVTSTLLGVLRTTSSSRAEFLSLTCGRRNPR